MQKRFLMEEKLVTIEAAVEIQRAYRKLTSGEVSFTKRNMCNLMVPLRDKYGLTDRQVLAVARNELSLEEIAALNGGGDSEES